MKQEKIKEFIKQANKDVTYNEYRKRRFLQLGYELLQALAAEMKFAPGSYTVRRNEGGIAVSGEITLVHDNLYVQFSQTGGGLSDQFMWRVTKTRNDYNAANRWLRWSRLKDLPTLAAAMQACIDKSKELEKTHGQPID